MATIGFILSGLILLWQSICIGLGLWIDWQEKASRWDAPVLWVGALSALYLWALLINAALKG